MISGLVLKYLNGECFVIRQAYETTLLASTEFNLTVPEKDLSAIKRIACIGEVMIGCCQTNENSHRIASAA